MFNVSIELFVFRKLFVIWEGGNGKFFYVFIYIFGFIVVGNSEIKLGVVLDSFYLGLYM